MTMSATATRYPCLDGKSVVITGGATGIGESLVAAFAAQHARVTFLDINKAAGKALAERLTQTGGDVQFVHCDISGEMSLREALQQIVRDKGRIDVLINNAADDQRFDARTQRTEEWHQSLSVNLHPVFFAAQTVQPVMAAQGGGTIINLSSVNVRFAVEHQASYIASKAAVLGLTKALARDFGVDNIRVNAISPGWVVTEKQLAKWLTPEAEAELMKRVCLARRLAPSDVAKLALFLASDDAQMITGQEFVVDGGRV